LDDLELDRAIAHYREHGYARLGKLASEETCAALRGRIDEVMLGTVKYPGLFFQIDTESGRYDELTYGKGYEGPSLNYRKVEKLELDPLFAGWMNAPVLERVVRKLIEGDVVIYRALVFAKRARGGTVLPYHQDGGRFWGLDRDPEVQLWTALDDAPLGAGCVEVFPGSHRTGLVTPLGGVVPANHVEARAADAKAIPLPAVAGEVLLIHNHLWHRSGLNTTDHPRRAFTVCYMSAATRCLRKKKAPRVFTPVFAPAPPVPVPVPEERRS
jgi:ectoine hydroxylase-related dioxygenase (phytanoyl-CoA dioxygenase family)